MEFWEDIKGTGVLRESKECSDISGARELLESYEVGLCAA